METANGTANRKLLWSPSREHMDTSRLAEYMHWLAEERGLHFESYDQLWEWSVADLDGFWSSVWSYFGVRSQVPFKVALADSRMPGASWFSGARLNYAEHALWPLDATAPGAPAIVSLSQTRERVELSMDDLRSEVARAARGLMALGVVKGDRVAAYVPNVSETIVMFLATAALGAVWCSCAIEFGAKAVVDRLVQIAPKVLMVVDGYRYGDKEVDRRAEVQAVREALGSVEATVFLPYLTGDAQAIPGAVTYQELLSGSLAHGREAGESSDRIANASAGVGTTSVAMGSFMVSGEGEGEAMPSGTASAREQVADRLFADQLVFEQVPFDHPLYVLFSSGTTGLPKAIIHCHGGILLEHLKVLGLHQGLGRGGKFFWFTTTGWMMWNYLVSGLLMGSSIVCFDGNPGWPDLEMLWRMAASERITYFGTSAAFIMNCRKAGIVPAGDVDLSSLNGVGSTGSPLPSEGFDWIYDSVKKDVHLSSISGGTDICSALVGSSPFHSVRAGVIACRMLGASVDAYDDGGNSVLGEQGELVVTAPMPSMPVGFFGDPEGERYREAYFDKFPGVWRHGDWITIYPDGSCIISGRSDATLNRGGVRIGTSEIYAVLDALPEVSDSLVVHIEHGEGIGDTGDLIVFVVPAAGRKLDEALKAHIKAAVRTSLSPRYVPDSMYEIGEVPRTLSGKKLEVPVKRILEGAPAEQVVSRESLANPAALDAVIELAESRRDVAGSGGVASG
ncbi:MAG: acetoacetate--CoA ligase [Acidimicrobiales bacterium]